MFDAYIFRLLSAIDREASWEALLLLEIALACLRDARDLVEGRPAVSLVSQSDEGGDSGVGSDTVVEDAVGLAQHRGSVCCLIHECVAYIDHAFIRGSTVATDLESIRGSLLALQSRCAGDGDCGCS